MDKAKIKVMLVDDHIVVRAGFRMLLASQNYIGEIVDIDRGELAVNEYKRFAPDVVVMDLSMPGIGGLEAIRRLYKHDPQVLILVYSIHDENIYVERALQAGARGYICKNSAAEILAEAVSLISSGKRYLEPGLLADNNQSCLKEQKDFAMRFTLYRHASLTYSGSFQKALTHTALRNSFVLVTKQYVTIILKLKINLMPVHLLI